MADPNDQEGPLLLLLGRLEGKLDAALARLDRHEMRLDSLEAQLTHGDKERIKDRAYAAGIATAAVSGIQWLKGHFLT